MNVLPAAIERESTGRVSAMAMVNMCVGEKMDERKKEKYVDSRLRMFDLAIRSLFIVVSVAVTCTLTHPFFFFPIKPIQLLFLNKVVLGPQDTSKRRESAKQEKKKAMSNSNTRPQQLPRRPPGEIPRPVYQESAMEKEIKQRAANVLCDHSLLLLNALSMNEVMQDNLPEILLYHCSCAASSLEAYLSNYIIDTCQSKIALVQVLLSGHLTTIYFNFKCFLYVNRLNIF